MAKFAGRKGDLKWGAFDFPVTKTQKATLDGLWYMMSGLPKVPRALSLRPDVSDGWDLPKRCFYSQKESNGDVVIGLNHESVTVRRDGRLVGNEASRPLPVPSRR